MRNGKKDIFFRIDENEYKFLIPKFKNFGGIGNYFMLASKEFSDTNIRHKLFLINLLLEFYKKYNSELSHIGGNLNQRMRHCNELSKIGKLDLVTFEEQSDLISQLKELLTSMQNDLYDLTKQISKP